MGLIYLYIKICDFQYWAHAFDGRLRNLYRILVAESLGRQLASSIKVNIKEKVGKTLRLNRPELCPVVCCSIKLLLPWGGLLHSKHDGHVISKVASHQLLTTAFDTRQSTLDLWWKSDLGHFFLWVVIFNLKILCSPMLPIHDHLPAILCYTVDWWFMTSVPGAFTNCAVRLWIEEWWYKINMQTEIEIVVNITLLFIIML